MRSVWFILLMLTAAHAAAAQSSARVNEQALEKLRIAAEKAHSDAVLILKDGEPVAEWYFGEERR